MCGEPQYHLVGPQQGGDGWGDEAGGVVRGLVSVSVQNITVLVNALCL